MRQSGGFSTLRVAARLAARELRSGLQGFYIFLACLALGVGSIAAIGSLSHSIYSGLSEEGQAILGGDAELRLVHRQIKGALLCPQCPKKVFFVWNMKARHMLKQHGVTLSPKKRN